MNRQMPLVLLLLIVLLAACGPEPTPTPPPTPVPPPGQLARGRFAPYVPVPVEVDPAAPAYTPDRAALANAGQFSWFSEAQWAALQEEGFFVGPYGQAQIYDLYKQAEEQGVPVFVTTDAVLHAFHILYDYALRLAEMEHFIGDLEALNAAMLEAAEADYARATGPVKEAAEQNLAFFAVGTRLLAHQAAIPRQVRDLVEEELRLIKAHRGIEVSPIFGYYEDYSQYVPRGHYTRNEEFERYFRAMMWYGRISFHLSKPQDPQAARRETRSALLIVRALHSQEAGGEAAFDRWERIYEPTVFFVGAADDLTVYDYTGVVEQVYGGMPDLAALADEGRLDAFLEAARELRPPQIVGGYVTDQEDPQVVTQGFRFMGRRFIPDSYVFQRLVYDNVTDYEGSGSPFTMCAALGKSVRCFPRGLDVPAVLGSDRALEILTEAGDTAYAGYDEQMAQLQQEFAELPEAQWTSNLYWNWLHTLDPLLVEKGAGYPYFMQSPAWVDKDLHTWLGSWAELRHDTILYAKQSYTAKITSMPPPADLTKGYVEPQPEVYARLAALTAQMEAGLGDRGLLNQEMGGKLANMEKLLLSLKTISEKELGGTVLSDEEYATIRKIGSTLEGLTTFSEAVEDEITSQADERMAIVADVHSDPNTNQVLEEGVGDAFPIYVVVLVEGNQVVAQGGVFSYYEFKWPMGDRLTDEAWQELLEREEQPERPAWTASFIEE